MVDAVAGASGPVDWAEPDWEEVEARLVIQSLPGVGTRGVFRLLKRFGTGVKVLEARAGDVNATLRKPVAQHRRDPELLAAAGRATAAARRLGMAVVLYGGPAYPERLTHLADPPSVLFLRGDPALLGRGGVAVVGSRRCTRRGRDVALALGRAMARHGVPVVSGLALGIDGAAHQGALQIPGPTIAVMGRGADAPYPRRHARLFRDILRTGLIVSEFAPGTPALPHHFPRRNRVLAALADTLVVVEAAARSGALISVEHALDLGLDVWSVPGPIDAPSCRGSNQLLAEGARALTSVEAFTEEIVGGEVGEAGVEPMPAGQDGEVLALVSSTGVDVAEVAHAAGLPVPDALAVLAALEVRGWVEQLPGMRFRRAG